MIFWLVVSTHLKNISQIGSFISPSRDEHKESLTPPPSVCFRETLPQLVDMNDSRYSSMIQGLRGGVNCWVAILANLLPNISDCHLCSRSDWKKPFNDRCHIPNILENFKQKNQIVYKIFDRSLQQIQDATCEATSASNSNSRFQAFPGNKLFICSWPMVAFHVIEGQVWWPSWGWQKTDNESGVILLGYKEDHESGQIIIFHQPRFPCVFGRYNLMKFDQMNVELLQKIHLNVGIRHLGIRIPP